MRIKTTFLLFIYAFLIVSCSKNEVEKSGAAAGSIISSVDGVSWKSTTPAATILNGKIFVTATGSDGTRIDISLGDDKVASYTVAGIVASQVPDNIVTFVPAAADVSNPLYVSSNLTDAQVGSITITEVDQTNKTISGTFTAKVKRFIPSEATVQITEGSFTKIPYTTQTPNVPGNTASAKVDNVDFTPSLASGTKGFSLITLNFVDGSEVINIDMPDDITTGNYSFGTIGTTYYATYLEGITTEYVSSSGSLVITKHDTNNKRIEGTFSFSGSLFPLGGGTVSVSNGAFAITYF